MDDSLHSHSRGGDFNLDDTGLLDADVSDIVSQGLYMSNGSSEHVKQDDESDGLSARTTAVLEHLGNKISRVRDLIKTEQKLRDGKTQYTQLNFN